MRYCVTHITEYQYQEAVSHCYNIANITPRSSYRQQCHRHDIHISPDVAVSAAHDDYFGNRYYSFEIQKPHQMLRIEARSEVDTQAQRLSKPIEAGISCAQVQSLLAQPVDQQTLMAREYLFDSPVIAAAAELRNYAAATFQPERPFLDAVMAFTQRIYQEFTYCPKSTTIATPLKEVLAMKKGVCQDFAHLQIACLRALGFAAKYVSGYIETLPPPGKEKLVGADASHAWLSVYSPEEGWVEFDPTNNTLATEQHIITAWGRDYSDIAPLKGVIYGGGEKNTLKVSVDVARTEGVQHHPN